MDPQVRQVLEQWLRTMGQNRNAQANPTYQTLVAILRGAQVPPAQVAMLLSAAKQAGVPLPDGALTGAVNTADSNQAVPDAPGLNSGTGQTLSIADRAAAAARNAASGLSGNVGVGTGAPNPNAGQGVISNPTANQIPGSGANNAGAQAAMAAAGGGGGMTNNGGYSGAQGTALGQDDNMLVRFAMQAAGLNPDRLTHFSKIAGRALQPLVQARRAAFGLLGNGATADGLPQDIANFAGEFTRGGANFFGNAQNYAQQVMGGDQFKNAVAGLQDQDQVQALYRSLMPLLYAGANPLVQQSAADTFDRQANQFNDQDFASLGGGPKPGGGIFMDWLNQQQNLDPITRRIFGMR